MATRSYYQILGVSVRAGDDEIKRAYREAARRVHPDQNPDDPRSEEEFKAVVEAYRVLSDRDARRQYDRYGIAPAGAAYVARRTPEGTRVGAAVRDVARAASKRLRRRRGDDIRLTAELEFVAACRGTQRVFELPRRGSDGRVEPRRLAFDLPPALREGQVLRWPGAGHPGVAGGKDGDLLVSVRVKAHPYLRRRGDDVVADLPLSVVELVEGGSVDVPTLTGVATLDVPAGTRGGDELRLRGRGIPGDPAGDAVFVVRMIAPKLDDALRNALDDATPVGRTAGFAACLHQSRGWKA